MILALLIVLVALILIVWVYSMYLSWKISEGIATSAIHTSTFIGTWALIARLGRRGWYSVGLRSKRALDWSNKHFGSLFVKLFPGSKQAFKKPDALTGLTHGPSSFFLKSISAPQKKAERLPRSKKML